jgi:hypothetical protein
MTGGISQLYTQTFRISTGKRNLKVCGMPYLAKNERDMGHPSFVAETGLSGW